MSGGAHHEGLAPLGAEGGDPRGHVVEGELDDGIRLVEHRGEVIALVDRCGHLQFRIAGGTLDEGLAHAALGPIDEKSCHGPLQYQQSAPG
jgi:hypothetical protein